MPARLEGTTPHRRLAAPCWGERGLRPQAQAPPNSPVRRAFSTDWLLGRWAGRDAGWAVHVPAVTWLTSPRRPGRRAVRRPACGRTGWAEARAGPYTPTCAREDERGGQNPRWDLRHQTEGGPGVRWSSQRRAEKRRGQRRALWIADGTTERWNKPRILHKTRQHYHGTLAGI